MRAIKKGPAPTLLVNYRSRPGAIYDGEDFTPVKDQIREQLIQEQGALCAYCMRRIINDALKMKVEHWHCQDNYSNEQLDYNNLLGVCLGNKGKPSDQQTCDTKKGSSDLAYNPASPNQFIEDLVRYARTGQIYSKQLSFDNELNVILNLNSARLLENRKAIIDSVHYALSKTKGQRTKAEVQKIIRIWENRDSENHLREYCAVAIYYLKKHPSMR